MTLFRPSLLRSAAASASSTRQAAREVLKARVVSTAYPVIPTCPSPSCECAEMPPDLDIERKIDLNGTMAPYSEHLVIASGQADWTSKIEDEKSTGPWGELTANIKHALSQKGEYHNPYHNVVVSTASFETPAYEKTEQSARAMLFPSFRMVDRVKTQAEEVPDFIRTFLLPETLHSSYAQLSEEEQQGKRRDISNLKSSHWTGNVHSISSPTIFICSHNSRDSRCGILGPLLHAEFSQYINRRHTLRNSSTDDSLTDTDNPTQSFASHPEFNPSAIDPKKQNQQPINIGMVSHIGGHKFAGNVIIYIPPDYHIQPVERVSRGAKPNDQPDPETTNSVPPPPPPHEDDQNLDSILEEGLSPLAGKGIWYGRVEPKHVEGIVEQTIGHGKIIRELFRGGVNHDGSSIRLPLY